MLDRHLVPHLKAPLGRIARTLHERGVSADQVSVAGFAIGLGAVAAAALGAPLVALAFLLLNRLADGIDGELARIVGSSDAGAFLDIVLDFVFYALFPLGFALADPEANALPAAALVASFVATGSSFLAFAGQAERYGITHPEFGYKGLYYLDGLAEGTETILCFVLFCLLPEAFPTIAWAFAALCVVTAANRIVSGHRTLRQVRTGGIAPAEKEPRA